MIKILLDHNIILNDLTARDWSSHVIEVYFIDYIENGHFYRALHIEYK